MLAKLSPGYTSLLELLAGLFVVVAIITVAVLYVRIRRNRRQGRSWWK